ncbi:hypothetical protein ACFLY4_09085 [Chloroflexota bacterium]
MSVEVFPLDIPNNFSTEFKVEEKNANHYCPSPTVQGIGNLV